jgi:hypothetical protein
MQDRQSADTGIMPDLKIAFAIAANGAKPRGRNRQAVR